MAFAKLYSPDDSKETVNKIVNGLHKTLGRTMNRQLFQESAYLEVNREVCDFYRKTLSSFVRCCICGELIAKHSVIYYGEPKHDIGRAFCVKCFPVHCGKAYYSFFNIETGEWDAVYNN